MDIGSTTVATTKATIVPAAEVDGCDADDCANHCPDEPLCYLAGPFVCGVGPAEHDENTDDRPIEPIA
ncbi:MAG TPA: hypothetical protein VG405_10980 [Solirubrobacteraceae bacterium]|nr:hypothetical protein [Solirubrobacteraceae bacterium]